MKQRWQVGWILFALVMVWAECVGDVQRLLHPHRTSGLQVLISLANATAVLGLLFYAFRLNSSRAFWRIYAPLYAMIVAAQLGFSLVPLSPTMVALLAMSKGATLVIAAALTAILPLFVMALFTLIALLRVGDW